MGKLNKLQRRLEVINGGGEPRPSREGDMKAFMQHMSRAFEEMPSSQAIDMTPMLDAIGDVLDKVSFLEIPDSSNDIQALTNELQAARKAQEETLGMLSKTQDALKDIRENLPEDRPRKWKFNIKRDQFDERIESIEAVAVD